MDSWCIQYKEYNPEEEPRREALNVLGNGYFATRGAFEENNDDGIHYPGTYLAGGYNRMESEVAGEVIENEDFVNWPNWLVLSFRPEGGEWLSLDQVEILYYSQILNLKQGILKRKIHIRDDEQRETIIETQRFVHMSSPHYAGLQWHLTAKNWSGAIQIKSGLDGRVINNNVERYSDLNQNHLQPLATDQVGEDGISLQVQTKQSRVRMAQAAVTRVYDNGARLSVARNTHQEEGYIEQIIDCELEKNKPVRVEKIVALYTSRDKAISEPHLEACNAVRRADNFEHMLNDHRFAWDRIWHRCDISLQGKYEDQLVLRLHIFHLMQTASKNTIDLDVGVPSRGLHGEAYRGHILWDELFIFPFLNFSVPEITREFLMYRFRRLPEAQFAARQAGYKGAMFPWQSGSNGREESQNIHLNPQSGQWIPDDTHLQRHVNAAIAYNIWQYYQVSRDREFLSFYGAEMYLQITSFWASISTYNEERDRYEILNVVGPDEYHTRYPDSDQAGLNNNAYTNVMAVWVLIHALKILDILNQDRKEELMHKLEINEEEIERWRKITTKMFVPFIGEGIIDQFEGFNQLKQLDWDHYHKKYGEILRLDRIMDSENDDVNRYKATKQADVLMLFYLLPYDELKEIFDQLGYPFERNFIRKNIDHYEKVTSHGSTLSKLVHSWVMARSNREKSWHNFKKALMSDFKDIQGGTTPEGIHLGAMAGTVDMIQRCYSGLEIKEDLLMFNPVLPDELDNIITRLRYRGHWLKVSLTQEQIEVKSDGGWSEEVKIGFKDQEYVLSKGEKQVFQCK
ncbi:MAG: glycoside hydrolase family 65 protein [Candidatus Cyclobacteriaceae bacterium M3_2C_046]